MAKFTREDYLAGRKEGLSQKEMAARHGCSEAMVSKIKRRCEGEVAAATPPVISGEVLRRQHDSLSRLASLADKVTELIELCELAVNGQGEGAWRVKGKMERLIGRKGSVAQLLVALLAEHRKQLELDNTIKRTKFDIERVMRFQTVVMEILTEVDPAIAAEVVRRLREQDATVSALDFGLSQRD